MSQIISDMDVGATGSLPHDLILEEMTAALIGVLVIHDQDGTVLETKTLKAQKVRT